MKLGVGTVFFVVLVSGMSGGSWVLQDAASLQKHRNLGKAYYEQGEYALAVEELQKVLDAEGAGGRDYFNAAMAYLQNGEDDPALAAFTTAKQMDPGLVEVDFGLGVLYKRQLRFPLALEAFQKVLDRDQSDACTWFNVGAVSFSMRRNAEAEHAFEKVLAMGYRRAQNFYVSALFRYASILARRGDEAEAQKLFLEFEELRGITPNVSLTPTALENGKYGRIDFPLAPAASREETKSEPSFREVEIRFTPCDNGEPSITPGVGSVFVTSPCGGSKLLRRDGTGRFADITAEVGLESSSGLGAVFIDYENRGFHSLFIWGTGENQMYRNRDGRFEDVSDASGLPRGSPLSAALVLDYDNDGQLDLFFGGRPSGLSLYRNDGDGTFSDTTNEVGLAAHGATRSRGMVSADFDEDGFIDVLVIASDGRGFLLANDGGHFFRSTGLGLLQGRLPARLAVRDINNDGWMDVVTLDEEGLALLVNRQGRLVREPALEGFTPHPSRWLIPFDSGGDGRIDFLLRDSEGVRLFTYRGESESRIVSVSMPHAPTGVARALETDGDGSSGFAVAERTGSLHLFRSEPMAPGWIRIELSGKRTNRQAIGAVVELKAGSFYQKRLYDGLPVTLYAGDRDRLDVVRVTWANGVIQNEVDVATGRTLAIEESERQTSSCPFLYIWDGEGFRFLTDVVGRAPLGEMLPGGGTVAPNPDDYVRIPPGLMATRGNDIVFQITEELREQAYLDAFELLAVDHPDDVEIYVNEKFTAPPFDPHRLYAIREKVAPLEAKTGEGVDVLTEVARADGRTVSGFSRHSVAGFAEEHALTLRPPEIEGNLWLFLTGWVYWPSSSSMKALESHDSMAPRPPTLEVKDEAGRWVTVVEDLGLPAGLGRTLAIDLTGKFRSRDRRVRVRSNFAVYWDEAFFATLADAPLRTHTLFPENADLHYRGFSAVTHESPSHPERYDYAHLLPEPPWNAAAGRYTRFGDVTALIEGADADLVVMAPGDEMTLRFDPGTLPEVPAGYRRSFILHVRGWAKDQDPNTRFSRTVEPLPQAATDALRTRRVPPLVMPLAPPESRRR
ncbi:MAG: hypothetical protein BMS9Abin37_2533 [Acidobacteriota bacterium]|nr:MAG: hypothetical protein BMS9Abin37_2533 [Acidobacteriota bacterium]